MRTMSLPTLAALLALAGPILNAAPTPMAMPEGTQAKASFGTEADGNPANLIDGDPATTMRGQGGTCRDALEPVWVDFTFPAPVANLAGVETGKSDPFHNYYPKQAQFWVDTDGNGTFDTLGASVKLGPAEQSAGRHLFGGRIAQAHALRFMVTEQNRTGLNRGFILDEMRLVVDSDAAPLAVKPGQSVEAALKEAAAARETAAKAAAEERRRNAPKADQSIVPGAAKLPGRVIALPEGTQVSATQRIDGKNGPENLFDGDPGTLLSHAGGTCNNPGDVASVVLRFPTPLAEVGGLETGESDAFHNYYPVEFEFWADSDGDSRCDTLLGRSRTLGPAAQCVARHRFEGRLPAIHALEIRAVEQHVGGGKRAFTMNEMRLVRDPDVPLTPATPRSYLTTTYVEPLPAGTTARVTVATEEGQGAEALLDQDPTTTMNPKQGTAKEGQPVSVFLTFPKPVENLHGIELGRSDPYGNYVWQELEIHADTDGDGTYDTLAGRASGGGAGHKRFAKALPTVHGLELRVTRQTLKGTYRAFMLSGVEGLVFRDEPGDGQMRVVLEDFEDLSSWRTWGDNTAQPEGERNYGGYIYLCGVLEPTAPSGQAVGKYRYCFHDPKQPGQASNWLRAKRGTVSEREAFMDRIEFLANPQGYPCSINFAMVDSKGKSAHTPGINVTGTTWQAYSIDLSPAAWPQGAQLTPPLRIENVWLRSAKGGTGDVLLDDIAAVGVVGRNQRVTIKPVWEGLAYDPAKPLMVSYRVRNTLDRELRAPLEATLYSAYDPKRATLLATRSIPLTLPKWGEVVQPVDFGLQPYGQYEVELRLSAPGVAAKNTDLVAVATLNGGRVNRSPMWIGSQHPADWISDAENAFVFREVVGPLGMDCYRTGAPDKRVLDLGLLCAAGFGGIPPHLFKKGVKRPDVDEPNDYAAYTAWVKERAEKAYAPYVDKILGVEYYNEPDLPDFCYVPDIDTYLKMWRAWAEGMRAGAPGIKLGTGGNTVSHGKEKKDFNPRMYAELAREADVAVWHAHGILGNFTSRHRMVENWLEKGGCPKSEQLLGNSEAGWVSHNSPVERLNQADCLVKKIGWAKAQANSLYYTWFTTTDTYDPQGGYLGGENWGLVAYNQRLKPSGLAMNELIRQLANTRGLGEVKLDPRLQTCAFAHADGTQVWLSWPNEAGAAFLLTLACGVPLEAIDLFGRRETLQPERGRLTLRTNGWPFYLRAPKGARLGLAEVPAWLTLPSVVGVRPGGRAEFAVGIQNAWGPATALAAAVEDLAGKVVAKAEAHVPADGRVEARLAFDLPADLRAGSRGYVFRTRDPEGGAEVVVPLTVAVGELVPRATSPLAANGRPVAPGRVAGIVLDQVTDVFDLVDDPSTPKWAGKEDLSAEATLAHDGQGILVALAVRDQTHLPGASGAGLWMKDSVQVALVLDGKQTEFGLTADGGGAGFCWMSPDADRVGKPVAWPFEAVRVGDTTTYRCYVPFADLGGEYRSGMLLRMTFLVNEDDGRGRVRLLKWFDGIHPGKDVARFGYLVLE